MFNKKKVRLPITNTPIRPIFSYYDNLDNSKRVSSMRRSTHWLRLLPTTIATLVIVVSIISTLIVTPSPRIIVSDSQGLLQDQKTYEAEIERLIADSIFNRNKITINTAGIEKAIKQHFAELDNVDIKIPLISHKPVVHLSSATPRLVLSAGGKLYLIDAGGRALLQIASLENISPLELPVVEDQLNEESIGTGKTVMSSLAVGFVSEVYRQFAQKSLPTTKIVLPPLVDELHLQFQNQQYIVKLSLSVDARQSAGTYLVLRERLNKDGIIPKEYIDLRIPERAYYR